MSHEVEFHDDACAEMRDAAVHYGRQVPRLADEFLDEIEHGVARIRQFPLLWPTYEGVYRRCLLRRFPYGLIYRIERHRIHIIAVAHVRRMPGYWRDREQPAE